MSNPSGSAVVFAGPLVAAQRVWSALRGSGVEAWLLDACQSSFVDLDSAKVVVRAADLERAGEILRDLDLARAPSG